MTPLCLQLYSVLMFYSGTDRNDLDTRWKALRGVKKSLYNKVLLARHQALLAKLH